MLMGAVVVLSSMEALAQSPQLMSDPLFGILYDPQKVHFDKIPPLLVDKCPALRERYVAAWVYGHLKTADTDYFLISGLMEFREDKPGGSRTIAPEEGDGVAVALRDSKCLVDQADYFLTQDINPAKHATPITAPEAVLNGILADAFRKYVAAFGGKQDFLKHVKPDAIATPIVRKQLEIFYKEVSGR
jgi:hypothetical protein